MPGSVMPRRRCGGSAASAARPGWSKAAAASPPPPAPRPLAVRGSPLPSEPSSPNLPRRRRAAPDAPRARGSSRSSPWHARRSRCAKAKVQSLMVHAGHVMGSDARRQRRLLFARLSPSTLLQCRAAVRGDREGTSWQNMRGTSILVITTDTDGKARPSSEMKERLHAVRAQLPGRVFQHVLRTLAGRGRGQEGERREGNARARDAREAREREDVAAGIRNPDGFLNFEHPSNMPEWATATKTIGKKQGSKSRPRRDTLRAAVRMFRI